MILGLFLDQIVKLKIYLLKPHFTTKNDDLNKIKGTGIGLYMTKQIIDKNKATIDVKNVDKGVCFTIKI